MTHAALQAPPRPTVGAQRIGEVALSCLIVLLCACAAAPPISDGGSAAVAGTAAPPAGAEPASASTSPAPTGVVPMPRSVPVSPDVKTRHALFKASSFDELPGWGQDNLETAWDAFQASCLALVKRDAWKPLCARAAGVKRSVPELRRFFEEEFTLFRILNADASRDGEVTGYYEPLINGSLRAEGAFTVPVYATPNDLYTFDWKAIPASQRSATVFVVKGGRALNVVATPQAGSYALDTSQFDLDARDRNWRVQLVGGRALPYRSRAEIEAGGRLDAPVVAYVDDALALYAMQVQGSGSIRLRDGALLRVQYAEQNGHPFKPLRLVSKGPERVRTRGVGAGPEEAESFELASDNETAAAPELERADEGGTRRGLKPPGTKAGDAATDALIDQLLSQAQRQPVAASTLPSTGSTKAAAVPTAPSVPAAPRSSALVSDPSYVFFRVAPDQSPARGPVGALGVPLTAGRPIAVDPRVTPLGYPVYMSTATAAGSTPPLQRLVVAQDTGGAIRGAIRADFFWGSGYDAGRQALRTRQRGQMWLLLPNVEVAELRSRSVTTRAFGSARRADSECLVADDTFCSEPD